MRNLFTAIMLIVLASPMFAQAPEVWGGRIPLGTSFRNTDSLQVRTSSLRDTVLADTLYSSVLQLHSEHLEGIFELASYYDELSSEAGTVDSLVLQVRLYYGFRKPVSRLDWHLHGSGALSSYEQGRFDSWNAVFNLVSSETLNRKTVKQDTDTWWGPADGIQFRLFCRDTSTDTLLHQNTAYID